jgi:hypothetical protein
MNDIRWVRIAEITWDDPDLRENFLRDYRERFGLEFVQPRKVPDREGIDIPFRAI